MAAICTLLHARSTDAGGYQHPTRGAQSHRGSGRTSRNNWLSSLPDPTAAANAPAADWLALAESVLAHLLAVSTETWRNTDANPCTDIATTNLTLTPPPPHVTHYDMPVRGLLTCFLVVAAAAATADVVGVRGSISQTVRRLNDAPCCRLWPRAIVADCFFCPGCGAWIGACCARGGHVWWG